jgi:hypothetical protein
LAEKSLIKIVKDYIEIQRLFFLFFEKKKNPPESNTRGKYNKTKSKQRLTNYLNKIHVKTSTQIPRRAEILIKT